MKNGSTKRVFYALDKELEAVKAVKNSIDKSFQLAVKLLQDRGGRIIVTGVGKSAHIAQKISATFTSLGHPASFLHPVEALHGDTGAVSSGDVLVAISFSGESSEVVKISKYLKNNFDIKIISVVGNKNSSLGKISDEAIKINVKDEGSPRNLAPMASTTASLVVGDLLAVAITSDKRQTEETFAKFHPGGSLGLKMKKVEDFMKKEKNIPLVFEGDSFVRGMKEMSQKKLGLTGVLNKKGSLSGIITDGDIRRFLVSGGQPENALVKDVMTRKPKKVSAGDSLQEALSIMESFKITSLFVVNKSNAPVGVIHVHDIVEKNII